MSGLRSPSPPRSSQAESSLFTRRRSSWASSLPEGSVHDDLRMPFANRRRSKHSQENLHLQSDWSGSVPSLLSSNSKSRRPSFPPHITETIQRARKPRVEHEESPEVGKVATSGSQPASDGKSLSSSWEINVKDLVGDAVGNVSDSSGCIQVLLNERP